MRDDVIDLLVSDPQSQQAQTVNLNQSFQNLITNSPNISLKSFKNEIFNQQSLNPFLPGYVNCNVPTKGVANEFEVQIKQLEERARELRVEQTEFEMATVNNNYTIIPFKPNEELNNSFSHKPISFTPRQNTNNLLIASNLIQHSANLDTKADEGYLRQIKEKLDIQLKETEFLKKELKKSKQIENIYPKDIEQINLARSNSITKSLGISDNSNAFIDELVELKLKLKESQSINEELKKSFRFNLTQLQSAMKECVEDKDKLIDKKNDKIRKLEEESESLKKVIAEHESLFKDNETYEEMCEKMQLYDEFTNKVRQLLVTEEKKREKSYFVNEQAEKPEQKFHLPVNSIYKGLIKCLEDYQGELKHSKVIIRELQNSWENKEKQIEEKETVLNEQFNKKCETIRQEYDRLMGIKQNEIEKLQNQIDEFNTEISQLKEKNRKLIDSKDVEINTLKLNNDSIKSELDNVQKELKQVKTRFDSLRIKEKENQSNFNKTLSQLESENEGLNSKYLDLTKELNDSKTKYESVKCQLAKYEQLIDNLNDQVVLLKREQKESSYNLTQLSQNFDIEMEIKAKLDIKCQELEQQVIEFKDQASKHANCESNLMNLQIKLKQNEHSLHKKTNEISKLNKRIEHYESKNQNLTQQLQKLIEEKTKMENELKNIQNESSDLKFKLQNSASLIQHSCKANSLLKEEKEQLENILKDNAVKLKTLKGDFDTLNEEYSKMETETKILKAENDGMNKKLNEFKKIIEDLNVEKESIQKELNQTKNDLSTTQTSFKNLNKKLTQTLNEKEAQISKLEQGVGLLEKEISLLKQVETLHKNQEETKVLEIASTIQMKLTQKKNKIEALRAKVISLETVNDSLNKEKSQLESDLKAINSKYEILQQEVKNSINDFDELKVKVTHYEKALEKAARKFSESEKKNETLTQEIAKLKEPNQANLPNQITNENLSVLNKFISMLMISTASQLNSNLTQILPINDQNNLLYRPNVKESLSETLLNNLKNTLESTVDLEQTSLIFNANEDNQESNKELCNNLENKLSILNKLGHELKKENDEVAQLLLQQQKEECETNTNCTIKNSN